MPQIKQAVPNLKLPESALCLTKLGWLDKLEEVTLQVPAGMKLEEAVDLVWAHNVGMLGEGELTFHRTSTGDMSGFFVFEPAAV